MMIIVFDCLEVLNCFVFFLCVYLENDFFVYLFFIVNFCVWIIFKVLGVIFWMLF